MGGKTRIEWTITPEQYEALPWLHIYAQAWEHDRVIVEGTPAALANLRTAIDQALNGVDGQADAYAADGEGYRVEIRRRSRAHLAEERLPYTRPTEGGGDGQA